MTYLTNKLLNASQLLEYLLVRDRFFVSFSKLLALVLQLLDLAVTQTV